MTDKKKQLPLATFRIAPDKADVWEKFKAKVEDNKTTGAALFWQFVQNYVDGVDTNIDVSTYYVDSNLDERIDLALEAKVDFSIRNISRVADEQYEKLVALLAQHKIDIDERIDSALSSLRSGNKENAIASVLAKIERIESTIGSQDNKIVALEAIVIGLPTTFISTKQVESIFDRAIGPLLSRLEVLETNLSEATVPTTSQGGESSSAPDTDGITESVIEPDSLPIIEAIANIAAPSIENSLDSNALTNATAPTAKPKTAKSQTILTRPAALAIAKDFGFVGTGQNLYDWAKAALNAKSDESRFANSEKLSSVGLVAALSPESKPAWKAKTLT